MEERRSEMPRKARKHLPFDDWPAEDRIRWESAFKTGDRFDESGPGAHLAESTRRVWWESYALFLGFVSIHRPELILLLPDARIDRSIVADYVTWLRKSRSDVSVAINLDHLRCALKLVCPGVDWSWLLSITKRIAAAAPRRHPKYHLVTSDRLYALGLELMDRAVTDADAARSISKAHAFQYRDGLIIALRALIPLRTRTVVAMRIGSHLVKIGDLWVLDIPAADTKNRRPLDYSIPEELSTRIDLYLGRFRSRIPGTDRHTGLWASNLRRPMCAMAIYEAVGRRTKKAFGFAVNLHQFRHAAASFWSIRDPANVLGCKDLLGHATFGTTEKHYIMAQSRLAGRVLASVVDAARKGPSGS
jgi:integrase/recombinase XerD